MDQHDSYLQQMCRVGGKRFSTCSQSTRYAVKSFETELLSVFEIDISHDDPDIHPPYLCILCQRVLKRSSSKSTFCGGGCGAVHDWQEHHRISCTTCSLFAKQSKGGWAPRKMKSQRQTAQLHADPDALVNTTQQSCILATYSRTTVSNVPSGNASSSTQRRRSSELRHVQHTVCGGSDGARAQEVAGLERLSRASAEQTKKNFSRRLAFALLHQVPEHCWQSKLT